MAEGPSRAVKRLPGLQWVKRVRVNECCAHRVPLQLADGSGTSFDLQQITATDDYEMPVILPDGVTCPFCTLQVSLGPVFS